MTSLIAMATIVLAQLILLIALSNQNHNLRARIRTLEMDSILKELA